MYILLIYEQKNEKKNIDVRGEYQWDNCNLMLVLVCANGFICKN